MPPLAIARMAQIGLKNSGSKYRQSDDEGRGGTGTPNPLGNGTAEPWISATFSPIVVVAKQSWHNGFHMGTVRQSRTLLPRRRETNTCAVSRSGIAYWPVLRAILPGEL